MHIEYQKWYSKELGQDMEFKVYGTGGKPVIVFPSSGGSFFEYEDFGMIEACADFINSGEFQFFTPSSVDSQSWLNKEAHPAARAHRHNQYDAFITKEFVPYIRSRSDWEGNYLVTGCSMGGYHSANFYFKHPDLFDSLISLSGVYSLRFSVGDYMDENIYLNSPIDYLPSLNDPAFLERYCGSCIVFAAGQGQWEEQTLHEMRILQRVLTDKNIFAWFDYWGYDVDHDWPWWRKMMPYFLGKQKP